MIQPITRRSAAARWKSIRDLRRRLERGYSNVVTFLMLIVPLIAVIDLISAVAIARPAQITAAAAARSCARMATTSLDPVIGQRQGREMALRTLNGAGYGSKNEVNVQISAPGGWGRGQPVRCTVRLTVPFGGFGLIGALIGQPQLTPRDTAQANIEAWRSDWR